MLLSITNRTREATDLGYLLHKHPDRIQCFELPFGEAHVFYPEASVERSTACLYVSVDPIGLVRGRRGPAGEHHALRQYVNDRPYAASSHLSVAIGKVFGTALSGRCAPRPELESRRLDLEAALHVLPARRGGSDLLHRLFEPLGYAVTATPVPLDETCPNWGDSPYYAVSLRGEKTLRELLQHLCVLIPVLDDEKHYWVSHDEVEKLLRRGEGWLPSHPQKELITSRYLRYQRPLTRDALARLVADDADDPDGEAERCDGVESELERPLSLNDQRLSSVVAVLRSVKARRVIDLGCGEGRLLGVLLDDTCFDSVTGLDVSLNALEKAESRLRIDRMPERKRARLTLLHGSLLYRDARLAGYDAAALVEVIEHLDPPRLAAMERTVFEFARPLHVIVTTPNAEYNPRFETLAGGTFRHRDHRFEWTRSQFQEWAGSVADRQGYAVRFLAVGDIDPDLGSPTQLAHFSLTPGRGGARIDGGKAPQ